MSEVPLYHVGHIAQHVLPQNAECEDRVLDGPASGGKGSKGKRLSSSRSK